MLAALKKDLLSFQSIYFDGYGWGAPRSAPRPKPFTHRLWRDLPRPRPKAGLTMSTVEIAELTDKDHFNVLNDARKMLADLKKDALSFQAIFFDSYGRPQPCLNLPKLECLTLAFEGSARTVNGPSCRRLNGPSKSTNGAH